MELIICCSLTDTDTMLQALHPRKIEEMIGFILLQCILCARPPIGEFPSYVCSSDLCPFTAHMANFTRSREQYLSQ